MKNKVVFIISKVAKYIFKEVLIKYLTCYMISGVAFFIAGKVVNNVTQSFIINISATLASLPIVFIVYDLYKKLLLFKSTQLINQNVDKKIINIFLKFIYFTEYFYNEIDSKEQLGIDNLNDILKLDKDTIFSNISKNNHHGYFIFSIFDKFDKDIDQVLNSHKILKFISSEEISILQEFINDFNELKEAFTWVADDNFILQHKLVNVHMEESNITKSSDGDDIFYDVFLNNKGSRITYYCARYLLYDEETLTHIYKLSGNKAKELSTLIHKLYKDINKWMNIRGIKGLECDHEMASCGRLYLGDNISFNSYMKNSVAIHGSFN